MRKMRGEVGKKTPKKEMDNPTFYHVTWMTFSPYPCKVRVLKQSSCNQRVAVMTIMDNKTYILLLEGIKTY